MRPILDRLKSRKLIVGTLTVLFLALQKRIGLDLDMETVSLIAGVAATWIVGEVVLDAKAMPKADSPTTKTNARTRKIDLDDE